MAEPRTLMQMAGAPGTPHPLDTSAVVMIDAQNEYRPGGLFDPETAGFAIAAPVAPLAGETVVTKGPPNAFAGTDLDGVLKTLEVSSLVVGGFMTHMCVSSTVRAALDLGYGCTVVGNACATRDLPDGQGGVVSAAELHRAELAALGDRFAVVVNVVADLSA